MTLSNVSALILLSLVLGCDDSHLGAPDAGLAESDARAMDAPPLPRCGSSIVATGPLCDTCTATSRRIDPGTSAYERFPDIAALSRTTAVVGFRSTGDLARMAVVDDASIAHFDAPLRGFASARLTRTPDGVFALGRNLESGFRAEVRRYLDQALSEPVAELDGLTGPGFAGDSAGCLRVLLNGDDGLALFRVADGAVFPARTFDGFNGWAEVAIDDAGASHVVYSAATGLRWSTDAGDVVLDAEPARHLRLAMVGNRPHVLYLATVDQQRVLRHAVGGPPDTTSTDIALDTATGCDPGVPPNAPEDICLFTHTSHHPVAVATDERGGLRLLYGRVVEHGELTASCGGEDLPPDVCHGWQGARTYAGGLHVLAPDTGTDTIVLDEFAVNDGRAVAIDDTVHAVLEVLVTEPSYATEVHHAVITAAP